MTRTSRHPASHVCLFTAVCWASGQANAQPPIVHSPVSVVEQFFERARQREFEKLGPLCTAESIKEIDLGDFAVADDQQARMYLFIIALLYPTPDLQIEIDELRVEGDTATVPIRKTIHAEYEVVVRREDRQWRIDLLETMRPLAPEAPNPRALIAHFEKGMQGTQASAQLPLLSSSMLQRMGLAEFDRRFNEDNFEETTRLQMLLYVTEETKMELGQPVIVGDRAVVPLVKTVPFSGKLMMGKEEAGWRIDLLASGAQSGAFPPEIMALMRDQVRQTACANNMKQVLLAVHMYAQDHDGALPGAAKWTDELLPYLNNEQVFRCPAHPDARCGYALNTAFAGETLKEVEQPAEQVFVFESTTGTWNAADDGASLAGRHNQGALIGFVDGHVQWMTLDMAREKLGLVEAQAHVMPDPNAFDDYVAAAKLARDAGGSKEAYREKTAIETQRAVVTTCAPALERLRQGFEKEFMNPAVRSFDALLPHLADFRELARVLLVEAKLAQREERLGDAVNSYLDMMRLGNDVPRGGPLIHSLVGVAIQSMALKPLATLAPQLDEQTAVGALERLEKLDDQAVPFWQTLDEEFRASRHGMLEQGKAIVEAQRDAGGPVGDIVGQRALPHMETFYKAAITEAREPYHARQEVPIPDDPMVKTVVPAVQRAGLMQAIAETRKRLVTTAIALRAYEARNGQMPDGLRALETAALLPSVPRDPFHDGPLGYRRTDDGYLLYSFGPDGDDDGGRALDYREARNAGADGDLFPG